MLSIIIPTLNEEKIIEKTLKNLKQFTGDFEIIISDGRSKDRTVEIARKYTDKIVVYQGQSRQNIAMGRNLGAKEAKGEFLLFLDADMFIPDPDKFFDQALNDFRKNPQLVGLIPYLKVFPEVANFGDKIVFKGLSLLYYFMNNILHKGAAGGEFQMVRAEAFREIGGYDERLVVAEDTDFFSRLSKIGLTMIDLSLTPYHTSRRAHKIGWPRLLWKWIENVLSLKFKNKFKRYEWEEIR